MLKLIKKHKTKFILALILIIGSILRLIWLDRVPGAMGGDELTYILTAKFMGLTGSDVTGLWNPFSIFIFHYPSGILPQAELPYFLLYPAVNLVGLTLASVKTTYALLSVLTILAIYLVTNEIFGKKTGLIAGAVAAFNPWLIFIGRTTYEVVPATLFYLLGIYVLLRTKGWAILLSFPLFVLAFYSYIGTKVAFIPIILVVAVYAFIQNKKKFSKQYISLIVLSVLLTLFFAFQVHSESANRTGQIFTPFSQGVTNQVIDARKSSIAPAIVTKILENKITVYLDILFRKTLNIFPSDYLFFTTDNFVSIFNHGLFYYIDVIFLFSGFLFLFIKKRKVFIFFMFLLFSFMLPEILFEARVDTFTPHLALFYVLLIIIISVGITYILDSLKNKQKLFGGVMGIIYILFVFNFLHIYFFEFPLTGSLDFGSRVLASYVERSEKLNEKVNVYTSIPQDTYKKYIFYTDNVNPKTLPEIKKSFKSNKYSLVNATFNNCTELDIKDTPKLTTVYQGGLCNDIQLNTSFSKIPYLTSGGEIYRIYNDFLCAAYPVNRYPENLKISNFSVEKLSDKDFCQAFITR